MARQVKDKDAIAQLGYHAFADKRFQGQISAYTPPVSRTDSIGNATPHQI
jgi:hypothetical protein